MSEAATAVPKQSATDDAAARTPPDDQAAARISELRVSGHLMTLDSGVFCMFPAPGSPMPDAATGLPGVRITQAPGGRPGAVSISTFRDDGWLDGSAALVRVNDSSAQILVTIYQSRQSAYQAPRLQVLRLSGDPAAQAAPAAPPPQQAVAKVAPEPAEPA